MPIPTAPSQAIDATPLLNAIRAAYLANAVIAANLAADGNGVPVIRAETLEPQDKEPYIALTLVVAVKDRDSSYDRPGVDATIQATLVTKGTATAIRTLLVPQMLIAALDGDLTAGGYTIWSVEAIQQRNYSDVQDEVVRRYGMVQYRVRATKP